MEIEKDFVISFIDEVTNDFAKHNVALAEGYPSAYVKNRDISDLAGGRLHLHRRASLNPQAQAVQDSASYTRSLLRLGTHDDQSAPFFQHLAEKRRVFGTLFICGRLWNAVVMCNGFAYC